MSTHHTFWQSLYQTQDWPWDLGQPSPHLSNFLKNLPSEFPHEGRVIVPGAGRGHDAALFANAGYEVTALDYVKDAYEQAQILYPNLISNNLAPGKIHYQLADLFGISSQPEYSQAYDIWVEHTYFCAIPPSLREAYVKTASYCLKPGGFIVGVFWEHASPDGPPYSVSPKSLKNYFQDNFKIESLVACKQTAGGRSGTESLGVLRKRLS